MSGQLLLAAAAIAVLCAVVMGAVVRPLPRLTSRVLPYTAGTRLRLGHGADTARAQRLIRLERARSTGSFLQAMGTTAVRSIGRVVERRSDAELERSFRQAGMNELTTESFRSQQVIHALTGMLVGAFIGIVTQRFGLVPILGMLGAVVGGARLRGRIERQREERMRQARVEIYTINQLLAMHLRTGAAPVAAISRVVERGRGVVVDDLNEMLSWIRHGLSESDAFRRGAEQVAEPSVTRTLNLLAVGSQRGTDLGSALLDFSRDLQDERAEEIRRAATRKRAAMLIPTIAVLAPVMLLFLAAPLPSIVLHGR